MTNLEILTVPLSGPDRQVIVECLKYTIETRGDISDKLGCIPAEGLLVAVASIAHRMMPESNLDGLDDMTRKLVDLYNKEMSGEAGVCQSDIDSEVEGILSGG